MIGGDWNGGVLWRGCGSCDNGVMADDDGKPRNENGSASDDSDVGYVTLGASFWLGSLAAVAAFVLAWAAVVLVSAGLFGKGRWFSLVTGVAFSVAAAMWGWKAIRMVFGSEESVESGNDDGAESAGSGSIVGTDVHELARSGESAGDDAGETAESVSVVSPRGLVRILVGPRSVLWAGLCVVTGWLGMGLYLVWEPLVVFLLVFAPIYWFGSLWLVLAVGLWVVRGGDIRFGRWVVGSLGTDRSA